MFLLLVRYANPNLMCVTTTYGGHIGWMEGLFPFFQLSWMERLSINYFQTVLHDYHLNHRSPPLSSTVRSSSSMHHHHSPVNRYVSLNRHIAAPPSPIVTSSSSRVMNTINDFTATVTTLWLGEKQIEKENDENATVISTSLLSPAPSPSLSNSPSIDLIETIRGFPQSATFSLRNYEDERSARSNDDEMNVETARNGVKRSRSKSRANGSANGAHDENRSSSRKKKQTKHFDESMDVETNEDDANGVHETKAANGARKRTRSITRK